MGSVPFKVDTEISSTTIFDASGSPKSSDVPYHSKGSKYTSSKTASSVKITDMKHGKRGATPPLKRSRVVKSVKTLTPRCNKMYHKCMGIIKSKRRLIMSAQERLKTAERLMEEKSFDAMVEQLPKHTKTFISMQINALNKNVKLRRFSNEEKLLALTLLKQSPKGYKLLQKLFVLPSRRTLNTFTHDFVLGPGLNHNVLAQLKNTVENWDSKKKAYSIVFDEVSLSPHLTFIEAQDSVTGFLNFGKGSEKRLCDHALVFMVRGIVSSWRQVLAFYYCEGATPALTLKNILKDVVKAVSETGLVPMALVCDQGSTFQTTLKSFQSDTKREQLANNNPESHKINISGQNLYIIYDPPHLIKGIRNNLLNKDLSFCGKTATWKDLIEVYKADCQLGKIKLLPKITDDHINPSSSQRMKVKTCTQALSERMSAALYYTSRYETHCDGTQVSRTMKNTAEAVQFFDQLFDSVNGSRSGAADRGKMRGPVKDDRNDSSAEPAVAGPSAASAPRPYFPPSDPDGAKLFRQVRMEKTETQASAFTAGYVSRKLIAKFKCSSCKRSFLTDDISDLHTWISYRERKSLQNRNLKY